MLGLTIDPQWMVAFLFATVRCGAWLSIAPPFQGAVPARVRGGLAVALGMALAPRLAATGELPTEDTWALVAGTAYQAAIGLALGFLVSVLFQAMSAAGGMIDAFGALTSAQLFDPLSKTSSGPMSRLYQLLGSMVLFATGGHLILIAGLVRTFDAAPVGGLRLDRLGQLLTRDVLQFLLAALQIAAPVLVALFVAEVLLGLATRAAPKLNIMIVGFGVKSLVLIMVTGAALPLLPYVMHFLVRDALGLMQALTG